MCTLLLSEISEEFGKVQFDIDKHQDDKVYIEMAIVYGEDIDCVVKK